MTKRTVAIIAHRGAHQYAPQNTLPAYQKAIELGLDYIEIDVQTTKDGKLISMHNDTVDATTNGAGPVRELTCAEIRRLDAGFKFSPQFARTKVPLVGEILALAKDRIGIYCDVKEADPAQLLRLFEEFDMLDQTLFYGGPGYLAQLQRLNPKAQAMPELDSPDLMERFAQSLHPAVVAHTWRGFTPAHVEAAHRFGAKYFIDILGDYSTEQNILAAVAAGVDGIQTDDPDLCLTLLR